MPTNHHTWTLTYEEFVENANTVRKAVLAGLFNFGEISKKHHDHLSNTYALVIRFKGMFGRLIDKILFKSDTADENTYYIITNSCKQHRGIPDL
jgi:uncharacterized protein with HEPN domain